MIMLTLDDEQKRYNEACHVWRLRNDAVYALRHACKVLNMENSFEDLYWIMMKESSGRVGARNPKSTATGLFQLIEENIKKYCPRGMASIGIAFEEVI